jgi:hypothetical protein
MAMPARRAAARVARLETVIRPPARKGYQPSALDIRLARFRVSLEPDLHLVTAEDADPEMFRSIQETLAFAAGDMREGARLAMLRPEVRLAPLPGETPIEALRRTIDQADKDYPEHKRREEAAIAKAKARAAVAKPRPA